MTVSAHESLSMLATCQLFSGKQGICSVSEPDDSLDLYIDFLEKMNLPDWINDTHLLELIDNVFHRKKEDESR